MNEAQPSGSSDEWLGLLVFDVDGTLLDSMESHAQVFGDILSEGFGVPRAVARREYFRTAGEPLNVQFDHVLRQRTVGVSADTDALCDSFWERIAKDTPPTFSDVPEALETLWSQGYTMGAISGVAQSILARRIRAAALSRFFAFTIGSSAEFTKGPAYFDVIQESLGISVAELQRNTALIGDGEADMRIGKALRMITIGRLSDEIGAQRLRLGGAMFLVPNLTRLVQLLQDAVGAPTPVARLREKGG